MPTPTEMLRELEQSLQPFGPPGARAVPGYGATARPRAAGGDENGGVTYVGGGLYVGPDGRPYVYSDTLDKHVPAGPLDMKRYQDWLDGQAGDGTAGDPYAAVYADIAQQEAQRAQEMHPFLMEETQVGIEEMQRGMELDEREMERRILDDRFERAQQAQEAAYLAESLAHSKRRDAVSALRDMTEYLVPPGMEYIPGMEPGGVASQVFGQAGMDYTATPIQPVASVDFSQFTQPNTQMDAAVQYLLQLEQQNRAV